MKKNSAKDYAQALYLSTRGITGADFHAVLHNFVQLLARDQRLKQADAIIAEFVKYAKKQEGIEDVEISSVHKLTGETLAAVKSIFGKKVEATEKVDSGILGGVIIKSADKIFDASLKTQLLKLKQALA